MKHLDKFLVNFINILSSVVNMTIFGKNYQRKISTILDEKDLKKLLKFVGDQPQYYPKETFKEWVFGGKLQQRLEHGRYFPLIFWNGKKIIGEIIIDSSDLAHVPIKNLRVLGEYQNNGGIADFLLKEIQQLTSAESFVTDISARNADAINYFFKRGFRIDGDENIKPLYEPNSLDFIIRKDFHN